MTTYSKDPGRSKGEKAGVPPAVIAAAVALLVLLVGWWGYKNLFAPPERLPIAPEQQSNRDWVKTKVKETGGDMSKLNPEDAQKMQKIAGGFAGMMWNDVKKNPDSQ